MAVPPPCHIFAFTSKTKDNQSVHEINTKIKYSSSWGYMAGYPCVYKKMLNIYSISQNKIVLSSGLLEACGQPQYICWGSCPCFLPWQSTPYLVAACWWHNSYLCVWRGLNLDAVLLVKVAKAYSDNFVLRCLSVVTVKPVLNSWCGYPGSLWGNWTLRMRDKNLWFGKGILWGIMCSWSPNTLVS